MPVYDYLCERCGPFTDMRPMAECDAPNDCPRCGRAAPRAFLTAPLSSMKKNHGAGCACCSGKSMRKSRRGKNGAKSFPGSRPWMISH